MPLFSAFTRFGHLTFSGATSHGENIYASIKGLLGGDGKNYSLAIGTHEEAKLYARAMHYARIRYTLERSLNNADPLKATELLPMLERDFEIVPAPNDTLNDRRKALAALRLAPGGARYGNVAQALQQLLGADFVCLRAVKPNEGNVFPVDPSGGPGIFPKDLNQPSRAFFLAQPIAALNVPLVFAYRRPGRDDGVRLRAGDVACVQSENPVLAEKVSITAVNVVGPLLTATATFHKSHDGPEGGRLGASVIAGRVPVYASTQRTVLVIAKSASVRNPDVRRRVNELLRRLLPGVTQFFFVENSGNGTVGPFTIGTSPIGVTTMGSVSYP